MKEKLGISFGAMSPKISKQIKEQGFKFNKDDVKHLEEDADALLRLRIRGYMADSVYDKILNKLFKKIEQHVEKENKLKK